MGVVDILAREHNTRCRPGDKVKCPFCGHKTMSVKHDDSIAKCFRPDCGCFVIDSGGTVARSYGLLAQVARRAAETLSNGIDGRSECATYLRKERNIDREVLVDAGVGVVPSRGSITKPIDKVIAEYDEELKEEDIEEHKIEEITAARERLRKMHDILRETKGWIIFPYRNRYGQVVSLKLRKPYTKMILTLKPGDETGLFCPTAKIPIGLPVVVTEGEFNSLSLRSAWIRVHDGEGPPDQEPVVCSVGGVNTADLETLSQLTHHAWVCYDNDESEVGYALVKNAAEHVHVRAFTTPEIGSDLDSFIAGFNNPEECWAAYQKLLAEPTYVPMTFSRVTTELDTIRRNYNKLKPFDWQRQAAKLIIADLKERGKFYYDGQQVYYFHDGPKKLIRIIRDDPELKSISANYSVNPTDNLFRYVFEELELEAFRDAKRTAIRYFAHYDRERNTLYLSNANNTMLRLTEDEISIVENGRDGVLFAEDPKAEPIEYDLPLQRTDDSPLLREIVARFHYARDFLTKRDRALLIYLWILSLFFQNSMQTKPILTVVGPKGSGKTSSLAAIGLLLMGEAFEVTVISNDEKDFDAAVSNNSFVVLDNVDTEIKWLNDRFATASTGGSLKRRDLYTTNNLVEFKLRSTLAITTHTPAFRRDDVADRLLIIKVDRIKDFKSENLLRDKVIKNRKRIMTELILQLQEILKLLAANPEPVDVGGFRMADFADFVLRIGRHYGLEDRFRHVLKTVAKEQSLFALEQDDTSDLLLQWVSRRPEIEVTTAELHGQLVDLAVERDVFFPFTKSVRGFGQYLTNIRSNLEEFMEISMRTGHAGKKYYRFRPRKDAEMPNVLGVKR